MGRKVSVRSVVIQYLEEHRPARIDRPLLAAICAYVGRTLDRQKRVSPAYVLDLLGETSVEIERSLGGLPVDLRGRVHFHDRDAAAISLTDMTREYEAARAAGDKVRTEDCRRAVRQAKERLKLLLRRGSLSQPKREEKQELLEWFLVWLEAPPLFPGWLEVRRKGVGGARREPGSE